MAELEWVCLTLPVARAVAGVLRSVLMVRCASPKRSGRPRNTMLLTVCNTQDVQAKWNEDV